MGVVIVVMAHAMLLPHSLGRVQVIGSIVDHDSVPHLEVAPFLIRHPHMQAHGANGTNRPWTTHSLHLCAK